MGMICYFRRISRADSDEMDLNPSKAYELILGEKIDSASYDELLRRSENATQQVQALHERHAVTLEKVRQANARREPISDELLAQYKLWLAEYSALTSPRSTRRKKGTNSTSEDDSIELQIDKSWHGLHFLLTGCLEGGSAPYSLAIMGGKEVPDKYGLMGLGPARKLTPEEVDEVSQSLKAVSVSALLARYNADEMRNRGVYAMGEYPNEDREYLAVYFEKVRSFYTEAATKQNGMLIYLR